MNIKRILQKKFIIPAIAVLVVICVAALFALSIFGADCVKKQGYVYIPTGATFQTVMDALTNGQASIKSADKFKFVASALSYGEKVKPGRYQLTDGMSYITLVRMLRIGNQAPLKLTFNNVRTIDQLSGRLTRDIEADSLTVLQLLRSDSVAVALGYTPQTLIAMFIPNTYEVLWNTSAEEIILRMKRENEKFWNSDRQAKLKATGLSPVELMTLASIVYEETKLKAEMATVAGVYMNRLRVRMPLQADPTVKFAVGDFTLRRILNKHLGVDSPYNTYKHAGLPPGPICMPSISAIDATLNYGKHKYLYFCAAADMSGKHNFATTLSEHNKNAQAYARALNSKKIYK